MDGRHHGAPERPNARPTLPDVAGEELRARRPAGENAGPPGHPKVARPARYSARSYVSDSGRSSLGLQHAR
jgi:hypothetical protein